MPANRPDQRNWLEESREGLFGQDQRRGKGALTRHTPPMSPPWASWNKSNLSSAQWSIPAKAPFGYQEQASDIAQPVANEYFTGWSQHQQENGSVSRIPGEQFSGTTYGPQFEGPVGIEGLKMHNFGLQAQGG